MPQPAAQAKPANSKATRAKNKEIASFIYTSVHTRDIQTISAMAADLETLAWNSNMNRRYMTLNKNEAEAEAEEEQQEWEELDEPIDLDIDEGDYVS